MAKPKKNKEDQEVKSEEVEYQSKFPDYPALPPSLTLRTSRALVVEVCRMNKVALRSVAAGGAVGEMVITLLGNPSMVFCDELLTWLMHHPGRISGEFFTLMISGRGMAGTGSDVAIGERVREEEVRRARDAAVKELARQKVSRK